MVAPMWDKGSLGGGGAEETNIKKSDFCRATWQYRFSRGLNLRLWGHINLSNTGDVEQTAQGTGGRAGRNPKKGYSKEVREWF